MRLWVSYPPPNTPCNACNYPVAVMRLMRCPGKAYHVFPTPFWPYVANSFMRHRHYFLDLIPLPVPVFANTSFLH